ncbi:hypothetical protein VTO42DRAFT_1353 [Malbranchea cinnamomea]
MTSLRMAKKELRSKIKRILSGVNKDSIIRQSSVATRNLISLPEYQTAKVLSVYLSMPSGEVETSDIVRDALAKGKQVFVPYIYQLESSPDGKKSSIMEMLALRSIEDYESLQPDKWGIPSLSADTVASRQNCFGGYGLLGSQPPSSTSEAPGLDFIVMPGMAFDESFARLGHGKGYYDHFLNRYHSFMKDSSATRRPFLGEKLRFVCLTFPMVLTSDLFR